MAKFRKKPVVIEAMQYRHLFIDVYNPDFDQAEADVKYDEEFKAWIAEKSQSRVVQEEHNTLLIETLEGVMTADDKDWIICGVHGELYPCKPDIFEETYEPA